MKVNELSTVIVTSFLRKKILLNLRFKETQMNVVFKLKAVHLKVKIFHIANAFLCYFLK